MEGYGLTYKSLIFPPYTCQSMNHAQQSFGVRCACFHPLPQQQNNGVWIILVEVPPIASSRCHNDALLVDFFVVIQSVFPPFDYLYNLKASALHSFPPLLHSSLSCVSLHVQLQLLSTLRTTFFHFPLSSSMSLPHLYPPVLLTESNSVGRALK